MVMSKKINVFVSYASPDAAAAQQLIVALERRGVFVWTGATELSTGDDWALQIEKTLAVSKAAVFLVSDASRHSQWSNYEMGVALSRSSGSDLCIIPVLLNEADASALPGPMRNRTFLRLDSTKHSIEQLAEQIVREASRSEVTEG